MVVWCARCAGGGGAAGGGGGNVPVQQVLTRVLTLLRSATATRALAAAGADGEPLELDGGDGEERRRGEEEEDEEEDEEETCGVCLDTGTFVDIMGCRHRLCGEERRRRRRRFVLEAACSSCSFRAPAFQDGPSAHAASSPFLRRSGVRLHDALAHLVVIAFAAVALLRGAVVCAKELVRLHERSLT